MTRITVIEADAPVLRDHCHAIRSEVFCGEQNVSREMEFDGLDDGSRHYLAMLGALPAGTARVRQVGDGTVKFERMAVRREYRNNNVGRALLDRALADAAAAGAVRGVLHAQCHASAFYEKFGFLPDGKVFTEAGIDHIAMARDL